MLCAALTSAELGDAPVAEPGRPAAVESPLLRAEVRVLEAEVLGPGERGELSLVLLEGAARDWPLAVRIDEGGVAFVDDRLDWSAVVDPLALQPRLRAPFVAPQQPGSYEVHATISYAVCGPQWCRVKRDTLSWVLEVQTPVVDHEPPD